MENSIFRKSSLERISSPEQLNEYVRIINPGIWLVLMALIALVLAVGAWAFTGTIPETVKLQGVAFSDNIEADTVYCYVPMSTAKKLSTEMKVQVSPDYASREEYGYIFGSVQSIGKKLITEDDLLNTFGNIRYVQEILPQGNVVEVKVSLDKTGSRLKWSSVNKGNLEVSNGSYCDLMIVIDERKPYELLFK